MDEVVHDPSIYQITHALRVTESTFGRMSEPCCCGESCISSRAGLSETEDGRHV
jgi:hypothetical protein